MFKKKKKIGRLSGWARPNKVSPFTNKVFYGWRQKRKSGRCKSCRGLDGPLLIGRWRGPSEKGCRWNPGAKNGPQLTASKDDGTSNLQMQELDFSKNLNEHGNGCFPRAPT